MSVSNEKVLLIVEFSCTPGQVFKKSCNDCTCTQDGKNAICTTKKCDAEAESTTPVSSSESSVPQSSVAPSPVTVSTTPITPSQSNSSTSVSSTQSTTQVSGGVPSAADL
ncbi:hypothetical protein HHI36_015948 [Cryptolaemus montrouzieri]|uniref:Pacifastin domain-containing protein n=1 Tax=Cryptolaemus montrouzieri TaxID=559131 RepID=A0ABD2N7L3_9CUCU